MSAQAKQLGAEQGADEERNEDVHTGTLNEPRSQQRRNAPGSTDSAASSAGGQDSAVRSLGNQYEVAVLYHPDLEMDLAKGTSKVEKIIADNKGKLVKTDNWGKRKLAYPIKKQEFAIYVFYTVEMPTDSIQKIEGTFNITDEVIRFLITKPDLKKAAKAEELRAEKAKKAAERSDSEEKEDDSSDEV